MTINLKNLPEKPGVYLFKDRRGEVIYVGKAVSLRHRVSSYFQKNILSPKTKLMIERSDEVFFIPVNYELEAILLEAHLIKKHQPFFNERAKDDKHPLYIKITKEDEYPRVFLVRREQEAGAIYFGPFPSTQTVKRVLKLLRSIFSFDTQRKLGNRPCFWSHIGLCNPCPSRIITLPEKQKLQAKRLYRRNINNLISVLSRKTTSVRENLMSLMHKVAKNEEFEQAARLRNQIAKLDYITGPYITISSFLENPNLVEDIRAEETQSLYKELSTHLRFRRFPSHIECFDASHTSLSSPTVGMATFINGNPEKSLYRRFRMKGKLAPSIGRGDDLAFLEEALRRRFAHTEWQNPDLVVIDGGKFQVGRAREVIHELGLNIPVIGLVKPLDNVVIPKKEGFVILHLKNKPALHLLERARDEAHRFSRAYHFILRKKAQFSTS